MELVVLVLKNLIIDTEPSMKQEMYTTRPFK